MLCFMKKMLFCWVVFCLVTTSVLAQFKQIKGKVSDDSTGLGLPAASVLLAGAKSGVQTDADGNFTIKVPDDGKKHSLVIKYVGYLPQEKQINGGTVNAQLKKDRETPPDEVIVIGYQTIRKKDALASTASVGAKDLKDIPINSAAEALNGRLAGVTATTAEGSPDAPVSIRVRGGGSITQDNSPLYIVDGVQVENGLSGVVLQDIQSIDVLKDAAATAIYGARGANGVIIITTKSGKSGKLKVNYNGFVNWKKLPKTLEVLSPYEFVVYAYEHARGNAEETSSFEKRYGTTWDTLKVYQNVAPINWQKEVLGLTGFAQTHNVGVSGGTKKTTFNFSYTNNGEKAIVRNSSYYRNQLNLKLEHKFSDKLKGGLTSRYTNQIVYGVGVSDDKGTSYSRLRNSVKYRPFLTAGVAPDEIDSSSIGEAGNNLSLINPIILANSEYRKRTTSAFNIAGNLSYTIRKNLTFRTIFSYDYNRTADRQFSDSITPLAKQQKELPLVSLDTTIKKTITNSNVLTYSIKGYKKKHDFDFLVGEETYQLSTDVNSYYYRYLPRFIDKDVALNNAGKLGDSSFPNYPQFSQNRATQLSFFGRVNYSLMKKYLFSFNMRADGASKFKKGMRWGYFPAASFAWRVSNEKFMKSVDFVNDLKLRVGYGMVGNNRISDYLYFTTYSQNLAYYGLANQVQSAYLTTGLVNELLKWETTVNRNIGLDVSILKNRFDVALDVYYNNTRDLLLNVPIDPTYGSLTQLQNIGKTSNRGIELQLNAVILRKKNTLNWTANFNISSNRNKVEALGVNQSSLTPAASWGISGQQADYRTVVGDAVGTMYGLVTDGFYTVNDFDATQLAGTETYKYVLKKGVVDYNTGFGTVPVQPGYMKFKDLNGDGVVDFVNDRTKIGNPNPKFTGGMNQQISYKQWDFSFFINFSYGGDVYNANKIEFTNGYTTNSNLLGIMKNRWRTIDESGNVVQNIGGAVNVNIAPDKLAALNAGATMWQPVKGSSGAYYTHSWAIEDASFVRINNISFGYSLPVKQCIKLHISKLRFYGTVNNVAVLTGYSGYDPEVSVRSNNPLTPGLDYSAYPKSRSFIVGLNLSL